MENSTSVKLDRDELIREYVLNGKDMNLSEINLEDVDLDLLFNDYYCIKRLYNRKISEGKTGLEQRRELKRCSPGCKLSENKLDDLYVKYEDEFYNLRGLIRVYKSLLRLSRPYDEYSEMVIEILRRSASVGYKIDDICTILGCESKLEELFGNMILNIDIFGPGKESIEIILDRWAVIIEKAIEIKVAEIKEK